METFAIVFVTVACAVVGYIVGRLHQKYVSEPGDTLPDWQYLSQTRIPNLVVVAYQTLGKTATGKALFEYVKKEFIKEAESIGITLDDEALERVRKDIEYAAFHFKTRLLERESLKPVFQKLTQEIPDHK